MGTTLEMKIPMPYILYQEGDYPSLLQPEWRVKGMGFVNAEDLGTALYYVK